MSIDETHFEEDPYDEIINDNLQAEAFAFSECKDQDLDYDIPIDEDEDDLICDQRFEDDESLDLHLPCLSEELNQYPSEDCQNDQIQSFYLLNLLKKCLFGWKSSCELSKQKRSLLASLFTKMKVRTYINIWRTNVTNSVEDPCISFAFPSKSIAQEDQQPEFAQTFMNRSNQEAQIQSTILLSSRNASLKKENYYKANQAPANFNVRSVASSSSKLSDSSIHETAAAITEEHLLQQRVYYDQEWSKQLSGTLVPHLAQSKMEPSQHLNIPFWDSKHIELTPRQTDMILSCRDHNISVQTDDSAQMDIEKEVATYIFARTFFRKLRAAYTTSKSLHRPRSARSPFNQPTEQQDTCRSNTQSSEMKKVQLSKVFSLFELRYIRRPLLQWRETSRLEKAQRISIMIISQTVQKSLLKSAFSSIQQASKSAFRKNTVSNLLQMYAKKQQMAQNPEAYSKTKSLCHSKNPSLSSMDYQQQDTIRRNSITSDKENNYNFANLPQNSNQFYQNQINTIEQDQGMLLSYQKQKYLPNSSRQVLWPIDPIGQDSLNEQQIHQNQINDFQRKRNNSSYSGCTTSFNNNNNNNNSMSLFDSSSIIEASSCQQPQHIDSISFTQSQINNSLSINHEINNNSNDSEMIIHITQPNRNHREAGKIKRSNSQSRSNQTIYSSAVPAGFTCISTTTARTHSGNEKIIYPHTMNNINQKTVAIQLMQQAEEFNLRKTQISSGQNCNNHAPKPPLMKPKHQKTFSSIATNNLSNYTDQNTSSSILQLQRSHQEDLSNSWNNNNRTTISTLPTQPDQIRQTPAFNPFNTSQDQVMHSSQKKYLEIIENINNRNNSNSQRQLRDHRNQEKNRDNSSQRMNFSLSQKSQQHNVRTPSSKHESTHNSSRRASISKDNAPQQQKSDRSSSRTRPSTPQAIQTKPIQPLTEIGQKIDNMLYFEARIRSKRIARSQERSNNESSELCKKLEHLESYIEKINSELDFEKKKRTSLINERSAIYSQLSSNETQRTQYYQFQNQ